MTLLFPTFGPTYTLLLGAQFCALGASFVQRALYVIFSAVFV